MMRRHREHPKHYLGSVVLIKVTEMNTIVSLPCFDIRVGVWHDAEVWWGPPNLTRAAAITVAGRKQPWLAGSSGRWSAEQPVRLSGLTQKPESWSVAVPLLLWSRRRARPRRKG